MKHPAASLIEEVRRWAEGREDVLALALVGSHARGDARSDSDVDLVIICSDPSRYLNDTAWVASFGEVRQVVLEDWGLVQSARVIYRNGLEVEFGVTGTEWVAVPPDRGSAAVGRDGCSVLLDRHGKLRRLKTFVEGSDIA